MTGRRPDLAQSGSLVRRATCVPLVNEHGFDFVSARVHNHQFHPYWGLIADQVWFA